VASLRARFFSFLLRRLFKPRLAGAQDVQAVRAVMNRRVRPALPGTKILSGHVGGVAGEWIVGEREPLATLLYVHGGGFVACTPQTHRPVTCAFALAGYKTFAPDYRLAPEHPFPAGLEDVVAAYRALSEDVDTKPLVVAGDSAGAGLVVSLLLSLREQGLALPAAAVLFSPFVDLAVAGESVHANAARCAMFMPDGFARAREFYIGDRDPRAPLVSPIYADLQDLPPLLIHVGQDETLLDDSRRLAERAQRAGVDATLKVWPVVPHVWQLFHRWLPEGRRSLAEACSFLGRCVGEDRVA
jgi:epsilon-lactone hydrolase